jgi:hypothetical protein
VFWEFWLSSSFVKLRAVNVSVILTVAVRIVLIKVFMDNVTLTISADATTAFTGLVEDYASGKIGLDSVTKQIVSACKFGTTPQHMETHLNPVMKKLKIA